MPLGTSAELDFMLRDCGEFVVFADASTTYGSLRREDVNTRDDGGFQIVGTETVIALRDGTQPVGFKDGALLTIYPSEAAYLAMASGVDYRMRTEGPATADGLRKFILVTRTS
jgi:hypothetical protein